MGRACYGFVPWDPATPSPCTKVFHRNNNNIKCIVNMDVVMKLLVHAKVLCKVQSNLDSSNTDGSFTMANSNSFLSPYEILPIA